MSDKPLKPMRRPQSNFLMQGRTTEMPLYEPYRCVKVGP